jgi:hypothetical protein
MTTLLKATIEALDQIRSLIATVRNASSTTGNCYAEFGLGRHVRHVADHFRALEAGLESGVVDYNHRRREGALEYNAEAGLTEILEITAWLMRVDMSAGSAITIESEISCHRTEIRRCKSTFERELLHLISHTIHHAAYAAMLLRQGSLKPDLSIGFAPATSSYLRGANEDADSVPEKMVVMAR